MKNSFAQDSDAFFSLEGKRVCEQVFFLFSGIDKPVFPAVSLIGSLRRPPLEAVFPAAASFAHKVSV
jgi:hypothetical protein